MKVRRTRPYVCVDVDYADHARFQGCSDLDAAAGTWLRCLAYSRAQQQDGLVKQAWVRRTFAATLDRIDELVAVGLLLQRDDGDFEIHAYAPRNQTFAAMQEQRKAARVRMRARRAAEAEERRTVRANTSRTNAEQPANERGTITLVPTSTSTSTSASSPFTSSLLPLSSDPVDGISSIDNVRAISRARTLARPPLPASERRLSGSFWLMAFADGIREQTGRPCTGGRMHLETLERIVTHHAPHRDAPRASAWLTQEAKAFAALWDGHRPAKGLTPDGLERWLNEGRLGPPVFGRPRIVQPPADQWKDDDWSDLGTRVDK